MSVLDEYIKSIYDIIIGKKPEINQTLVKIHTKYFEDLGDISFPLLRKNWLTLVESSENEDESILNYKLNETDCDIGLDKVRNLVSECVKIKKCKVLNDHVHIFLDRFFVIDTNLKTVLREKDLYGKCALFDRPIELITNEISDEVNNLNLSELRLIIIKKVTTNLLKFSTDIKHSAGSKIYLGFNRKSDNFHILCGAVINQNGVKDIKSTSCDLFNKRASDMRMMAQHRYRVCIKPESDYIKYFYNLGVASVTIELLSNKPQKSIKVSLNSPHNVNKGPSFIFYNCARLSTLLVEFDRKVQENIYPKLPGENEIKFELLNQPEEWELFFGYILQFPLVIRNCVRDIEKGILNTQNLITFLSNLSSVFSVYYRRIRILTDPRQHLFAVLHARIYLLRGVQIVFHNALRILNIEPIKEM